VKKTLKKALHFFLVLVMVVGFAVPTLAHDDRTISVIWQTSLFLMEDNALWAFGDNTQGRLGDGTNEARQQPVMVMDNVRTIVSHGGFDATPAMVIRTDGILWAWGANAHGQVGDGTTIDRNTPVRILDNVVYAVAGFTSFAIREDGSLWRWGANSFGDNLSPVRVMENVRYVSSMGGIFAIQNDNSLWFWGSNSSLIENQPFLIREPIFIMDNVKHVSGSSEVARVLRMDGSIYAWGRNMRGEVGNGTTAHQATPVRVLENVVYVTHGGTDTTAAITADGGLYIWGNTMLADIGEVHRPVRVMEDVFSVSLVAGVTVLKNDRTLWGWGGGHAGVIDPARRGSLGEPVLMLDDVVAFSRDIYNHAALRSDGSLWIWGANHARVQQAGGGIALGAGIPIFNSRYNVANGVMLPQSIPFSVSSASAWARDSINQAHSHGLIPVALQGDFAADATRAEFAAFAVALFESVMGRGITERVTFNDTDDVNVQKMGGLGVVGGVGGGNFNPNGLVSRQEAAIMLARLMDVMGRPLPQAAPSFADNAMIADWAIEAVGQVQAAGIMGGVGNNQFNPTGQFTREQSVIVMLAVFEMFR